jgi:phage anti-repressor protein
MKTRMSSEQEQIFMMSHYLYLQHGSDSTQFVIDFDDVWKNVELSRRDSAKRILIKNFTEHLDYKIAAPHLGGAAFVNGKNLGGSGQNKELILLTVDCFKNFCMIAATSKAKEIRTYYIKMENIMHEYYKNFKLKTVELQHTLQTSQNALQLSIKETLFKRHEVLIESNKNKWVVYFCKVQLYDDGSFILKVGETIDIKNRMDALRCDFGTNIILSDVFTCENSIKFEKSLHNSNELTKYKYTQLEHKNKKFSMEAYHIPSQKEYEKIVKFANNEMNKYNNIELTKLRIEEKRIDAVVSTNNLVASLIPLCKNYDDLMNILNKTMAPLHTGNIEYIKGEENHIQIQNNCAIDDGGINDVVCDDKPEIVEHTTPANSTGPIVQIYHAVDLTKVVQVYNSITEATRDFNYNNKTASFTAIKKAYQNKTLYHDYRWHFIFNRTEPNLYQPYNIGETLITQARNQGQVAMLNIDKTKIIKVFKLAKDAAKEILQHPSAMSSAIKHSTPLNNHYWMRWENVSLSLQDNFLQSTPLPDKEKNVRGIKIKQMHPTTNEFVKLFVSYTDIQKELKISVRKIKELVESNETYKGKYKFKLF